MLRKQFYEAHEAEELLVKFEENFCGTGDTGESYNPTDPTGGNGDNGGFVIEP